MSNDWLNLSEAAEMLGVHPSTVRSWADRGYLPVQRTQGGHRRFRREDVEQWIRLKSDVALVGADTVIQNMLRKTRLQIGDGCLENQTWYHKLDEEARHQYRLSGRSLMMGLMTHLHTEGDDLDAEARSLGYEYASRGRRYGLTSAEAAHAFLFFRNNLLEAMLTAYEAAGVHSPHAWTTMFRKVNHFADLILITLLETYDGLHRGRR